MKMKRADTTIAWYGALTTRGRLMRFGGGLLFPGMLWLMLFLVIPGLVLVAVSFLTRGPYGELEWTFTLENYRRLAVKLLRAVPAATRNIGARKLETCGETQFYPSRHAFDEELRWRFWRGKTAE